MRIIIAFMVAFGIGAGSRWTGVPSLAPQAIVGALLIVAMSTGYVSADRLLKRISSPSVTVSVSTGARVEQSADKQMTGYGLPADPDREADVAFWRRKSEGLQLIIADLLLTNQQLRASGNAPTSQGDDAIRPYMEAL